jgi:hypothetical protein
MEQINAYKCKSKENLALFLFSIILQVCAYLFL